LTATAALISRFTKDKTQKTLRVLSASGQLGYGIPGDPFEAGMARDPHIIGCDMGSIDVGPHYLGAGRLATSKDGTVRDLRQVLHAALAAKIPLIIGSAGTAGAAPHLDATLSMIRSIAREDNMKFRMASIRADIEAKTVKAALQDGRIRPLGKGQALSEDDIEQSSRIVAQMGVEAFIRALQTEPDIIVAGRSCDTAIFASVPSLLGFPKGPAMHMAKIIECASICCDPGGRDAMLGTLEGESFVLDSMNPARHATPRSVAAHSLYEQSDPNTVYEPEGILHLEDASYEAVDDHRARVRGARWESVSHHPTIKIEGAARVGERAVVIAASSDPHFIASLDTILPEVEGIVRGLVPESEQQRYKLYYHVYGINGVLAWPDPPSVAPREVCVLIECIADTAELAKNVASTSKQYLLHHGFPGRKATAGNVAFPFTPPELDAGTAYRFSIYHIMEVRNLSTLFPVHEEDVG
jgi:hypothetical protein